MREKRIAQECIEMPRLSAPVKALLLVVVLCRVGKAGLVCWHVIYSRKETKRFGDFSLPILVRVLSLCNPLMNVGYPVSVGRKPKNFFLAFIVMAIQTIVSALLLLKRVSNHMAKAWKTILSVMTVIWKGSIILQRLTMTKMPNYELYAKTIFKFLDHHCHVNVVQKGALSHYLLIKTTGLLLVHSVGDSCKTQDIHKMEWKASRKTYLDYLLLSLELCDTWHEKH